MTLIARLQVAAGALELDEHPAVDLLLRDIVSSVAAVNWPCAPLVEFIVARSLVVEFFCELANRPCVGPIESHVLTRLGTASAESFSVIVKDTSHRVVRLRTPLGGGGLDDRVRIVLELIRSQCDRRIRINELAGAVGLSRWHLERLTKQQTGASLRQHLASARLERAINLVKQHPLSVKELAFRAGYGNANAFSRDFRRWYGTSPRAWLRSH